MNAVVTTQGRGSELSFYGDRVTKRFTGKFAISRLQSELQFYYAVPWACPALLDVGDDWFTTVRLTTAAKLPNWVPGEPLWDLFRKLAEHNVHHRDSNGSNVVITYDGQHKLIDWGDTAIFWPGDRGSYDLLGPEASGVPRPRQHWNRANPIWWSEAQIAKYPRPRKAKNALAV